MLPTKGQYLMSVQAEGESLRSRSGLLAGSPKSGMTVVVGRRSHWGGVVCEHLLRNSSQWDERNSAGRR